MADNVEAAAGSGGAVFATDDLAGVHHPRVKLEWGPDGTANEVDDAAGKRVPVKVGEALPTGGNTIGFVGVAGGSVALLAGAAHIGEVSLSGALPAGGNLIGGVVGPEAQDAVATANPFVAAGRASDAVPSAVSADGDVVRAWHDRRGAAKIVMVDDAGDSAMDGTNNAVRAVIAAALPAGSANIGDIDVASMPTGASAAQVQGTVAHDGAAAQNPVQVAARANANEPAAVSANGDVTHLWADLLGRLVMHLGHPNPEAPVSLNATASGGTSVIAAPGASTRLVIRKGSVHNRASTNRLVRLEDGSGGTIRWRAELAAEGGGAAFDFGSAGWRLTANTALFVNLDAAGDIDINITEYSIEAT